MGAGPEPPVAAAQPTTAPAPAERVDPAALGYVTFPWPAADLRARAIVLGCAHACALVDGGRVECWGRNQFGELGDGTEVTRATRAPMLDLPPVVELASGCASTCARTAGGEVWCWGGGDLGEMGDGDLAGHRTRPVRVPAVSGARSISSSGFATCALVDDQGHARCWGNLDQHPGAPIAGDASRVRALATPMHEPARLVATSTSRACVLARDETVSCWGSRESVGLSVAPVDPATPMTGLDHPRDLAGGAFLTCASDARGVACWGSGVTAFGLGSAPLPPTRIAGLAPNVALAVGDDFVCGTHESETRCAGYGELVDDTGRVHPLGAAATRVRALDGLHGVVASASTVCGLDARGAVRCVAWLSGREGEPAPPPS